MAKIKVTQTRSSINRTKKQKLTLAALGLRRLGMTVEHEDTPNILGMIKKVSHFLNWSETASETGPPKLSLKPYFETGTQTFT